MTDPARPFAPEIVTLFGGAGFVGNHVLGALLRRNYRVRVAVRRPHLAGNVRSFGFPGQVHPVQANLRFPDSVRRAVEGASVVINLVGILRERGAQTFEAVHAEGARTVAAAAAEVGARLVHMSALGADLASESAYARTKAQGEVAAREARPDVVIVRPSVVFGGNDGFFNRFAYLARMLPVVPVVGAQTRFQPVFAGDVARAVAKAVDGTVAPGVYELGGPEILTLRQVVEYVLRVTERRRAIVDLPFGLAGIKAGFLEFADMLTLGLLPDNLIFTRDQVALLRHDNVVSERAIAEGRTLEGLGIAPTALEAIVPSYLVRYRRRGQFETRRMAPESAAGGSVAAETSGRVETDAAAPGERPGGGRVLNPP